MAYSVSRLTLYLSPHHDLYHSSYLLATCSSLAASGVPLRIKIDRTVDPIVPQLHINDIRLAVDLHDSSKRFSESSFQACHVYAKRSLLETDVPEQYTKRVIPFGLNYGVRTRAAGSALLALLARSPGAVRTMRPWRYAQLPTPEQFEREPWRNVEPLILFQTRVWEENELGQGDTAELVNGRRVALVRALQKEFGKRFVGGLVPTQLARRLYADAVTNEPSSSGKYLKNMRRALVTVSTRGLHHSTPFKIPEYISASKCIVAEPLVNSPAFPLIPGVNYLPFNGIDECLRMCDRLLGNAREADEMRRANWDYYQQYLRFDRRLLLLASQARTLGSTA